MTIAQALKEKNKRVASIQKNWDKLNKYNSIPEGAERPYNMAATYEAIAVETAELIKLKHAIHTASAPVREDIFSLSEYKNIAQRLKAVDVSSGPTNERYTSIVTVKVSELGIVWQDSEIAAIESKIESLQEKLDAFNHTNHI